MTSTRKLGPLQGASPLPSPAPSPAIATAESGNGTGNRDKSNNASASITMTVGDSAVAHRDAMRREREREMERDIEREPRPDASDLCAMCRTKVVLNELTRCACCATAMHVQCGNLPYAAEDRHVFCRASCYTNYHKRREEANGPKPPRLDFHKLANRVHAALRDLPRRKFAESTTDSTKPELLPKPNVNPVTTTKQPADRSKVIAAAAAAAAAAQKHSRNNVGDKNKAMHHPNMPPNASARGRGRAQRPSPPPGRSISPAQPYGGQHVDLTREPSPLPSNRPMNRSRHEMNELDDDKRKKRQRLPEPGVSERISGLSDTLPPPPNMRGDGGYDRFASVPASTDAPAGARAAGLKPLSQAIFDQRKQMGPPSLPLPMLPKVAGAYNDAVRVDSRGYEEAELNHQNVRRHNERTNLDHGRPIERYHQSSSYDAPSFDRNGQAPGAPGAAPVSTVARANIPWLNPTAFPSTLYDRFVCEADDLNGVFRIDLSPVFAEKKAHLYQNEIDFFFRCFESADVSLVVKGMASELNQYIWAWPFILESCGPETQFLFDHFQFTRKMDDLPELEYVGQLKLSMACYNSYLEKYLSGVATKEAVVLEDYASKKAIKIVAAENIIALNHLVIAEHCTQLYSDLTKGFQWDVFAGGIHCLLQYLPQSCRHERFSSPMLHFNFPGARGSLRDPGNGTTDSAYQVLVGCVELVIFERLEPKDRDEFMQILRRAGYDAEKKSMLLDSHLRALRAAGFAWSTVLLHDGEFVHVNKGRLHFWRVVEKQDSLSRPNAPCVFLSWEWVYQGVSQRGISTECWFAMKNASLFSGGWAFDPRKAIVEATKRGLAIVRTGQFLNTLAMPSLATSPQRVLTFATMPTTADRDIIGQRQEQMVLFLESILPCMDAIVDEEYELGLGKDDSQEFRKIFDDEVMWKAVDAHLSDPQLQPNVNDWREYQCGICGLELTNIYKQCLGCTVYARRSRPNMNYKVFRICFRCHAQPEHHHFKPRGIHSYYEKLVSSEGHTGLLPATRRYQAVRSYFKCRCTPSQSCTFCGGCESCCCLCHTMFQTRFRYATPEYLDHLRSDIVDIIKWHKQQR